MLQALDFCCPSSSTTVTSSPDWLHEVKNDGYRLRLERDGNRVRLITRGGYNWTARYPWIVESALKNRQEHFVIDGEAVVLGVDGVPDFNALHSRKTMRKCSSTPSMFSRSMEGISETCRWPCARRIWHDCSRVARTASL